ncbi:hypothetical protein FA10DRAFT_304412 [Acaromyces ingoldii]|uniref:FMR1-interacting protein 1 conserved domain-containing protein n=1 Tax=Acaromyces ingoldii TaxID=215250 RepID=A0A316YFV1_9BASI|nr:hypothetical protein FA10DRAFT_304412 [Acaromyces ingoldii]PWN86983.1 hypothetical protein FA10DRAFT_304412 [Acaromyces ingoldii]
MYGYRERDGAGAGAGAGRGRGGRGRGRGGGGGSSSHSNRAGAAPETGQTGHLVCGHALASSSSGSPSSSPTCQWRTSSALALTFHRADRHLVYPPGGKAELDRMDPLLDEERRKRARASRRPGPPATAAAAIQNEGPEVREGEGEEEGVRIEGLSIRLDSDELVRKWTAERRKRWPTDERVRRRIAESWADEGRRELQQQQRRQRGQWQENKDTTTMKRAAGAKSAEDASDDDEESSSEDEESSSESSSSDDDDDDDDSSGSDMDPVKDAVSSKVDPSLAQPTPREAPLRAQQQQQQQQQQRPRKRPREAPRNPFEPRHLLRALLSSEIDRHVDAVAQVIRFLVRNGFLRGVEQREGQAAEQARRRPVLVADGGGEQVTEAKQDHEQSEKEDQNNNEQDKQDKEKEQEEKEQGEEEQEREKKERHEEEEREHPLGRPLFDGALATATAADSQRRGLFRPPSPRLRGLDTLAMPPEPDALVLMDPLRAADPKLLPHQDLYRLACDAPLRALLSTPDRALLEAARLRGDDAPCDAGLVRALTTLDALPSLQHRTSALELILGVSQQSRVHAHQLAPTHVRRDHQPSLSARRIIGEVELFRLGLRVGPREVDVIKRLAARISHVVGDGPRFELDEDDGMPDDDGGSNDEAEQAKRRMEARLQAWSKEADWRDSMRKLGLDL